MKVTLPNVAKFWVRLMFPPDTEQYRHNRLVLKSDMPWEPWLHAGTWIAVILVLITGEKGVIPPVDGIDWYWIAFGLISPPIGFFSVWTLHYHTGRARYYALWGRMIADLGLAVCIGLYQLTRFIFPEEGALGFNYGLMSNMILFLSMWFTLTLVLRDIRFIIKTEQLAAEIYRDVHFLTINEWAAEWGADGGR